MKLAIIRRHYRPDGGAERIIQRILQGLQQFTPLEVSLITQQWAASEDVDFRVLLCPKRGVLRHSNFRYFVSDVQQVLNVSSFNLIQSHERVPGCQVYRAGDGVHAEWLRIHEAHLGRLGRLWQGWDPFHRSVLQAEQQMFTHDNLRKIICIAESGRQDVLKHYPEVDTEKLEVVYNGIDLQTFSPVDLQLKRRLRMQLNLPEDAPLALFVGSGFERKGLKVALTALAALKSWHFVVVGKDRHLRTYQKYADQLAMNQRVHFVGVQNNMPSWYRAADVLVHPAWYEPFGNVVLEAMASGLPAIVSNHCGSADLIEEGINGFVIDVGNDRQLAERLQTLHDPEYLDALGRKAREVAARYPIERMIKHLIKIYHSLLK